MTHATAGVIQPHDSYTANIFRLMRDRAVREGVSGDKRIIVALTGHASLPVPGVPQASYT
jgi:hypothetical protein